MTIFWYEIHYCIIHMWFIGVAGSINVHGSIFVQQAFFLLIGFCCVAKIKSKARNANQIKAYPYRGLKATQSRQQAAADRGLLSHNLPLLSCLIMSSSSSTGSNFLSSIILAPFVLLMSAVSLSTLQKGLDWVTKVSTTPQRYECMHVYVILYATYLCSFML